MKLHLSDSADGFIINGYGDSYVDINGARSANSLLLTPEGIVAAELPPCAADLTAAHLEGVAKAVRSPEVFLLGAGQQSPSPRMEWFAPFVAIGISLEIMSLPAACRTYNILHADGRQAAAILLIPG